jgi:hypothetical protein
MREEEAVAEIRLTFETDNFASVSQILVDMGIAFRVEPVGAAVAEPARAPRQQPASPQPRRPAKSEAKRAGQRPKPARQSNEPSIGAQRLRDAITRTVMPSGPMPRAEPPEPSSDD